MRTALALSPHLDDAVFSAGGALARLAGRGWRVVIATVFTGNVPRPEGFALACQLDKGLPPEADYMALRRREDERACEVLGTEPRHLPLLEAPHRGYDDPEALFGPARTEDIAESAIAALVASLLDELSPDLVLAPQAIGGHVDHVAVRLAAAPLLQERRHAWWTDWPYAARKDAQRPFGAARSEGWDFVPAAGELARKTDACLCYETQIGFQFGSEDALRANLARHAAERFDAPSRAAD